MPKSIFEMITSQALATYYETLESNKIPLIGEGLFPNDKKMGLKLDWIKGLDNLPIILAPSAFDAKPVLRDRGGVAQESTKMPFFRESMRMGEEDRQQLLMFLEANNDAYARTIINRIYDDATNLVEGARIVPEVMRMGLISDGKFTIASSNEKGNLVNYTYNYDPEGKWATNNKVELLTTNKWSDHANSNPVKDIIDIKKKASARGTTLVRAIIGYETWNDICENEKILKDMNPVGYANMIVTEDDVKTYMARKTGITFQVYDKIYKDQDGNDQHFYPVRGTVTFLPANTLGKTWYGTTPEEADLMSGNTLADVTLVNTGIALSTEKIALPVNLITWASEIVLPSFEGMDMVYNIKYTA